MPDLSWMRSPPIPVKGGDGSSITPFAPNVASVGTPTTAGITATGTLTGTWGTGQNRTAGNVLVAVITVAAATTSTAIPTPTGWTKLNSAADWTNGTVARIAVYTKTAAGSDAAWSATVTLTTGSAAITQWELNQANATTPVLTTGSGTATTGVCTATSSASVTAGCYALAGFSSEMTTATSAITFTASGTGYTAVGSVYPASATSSRGHSGFSAASGLAGGSTTAAGGTFSGTQASKLGVVIVIQPTAPPASPLIQLDASTPAAVELAGSTSATATTASFTPPANSLVLIAVAITLQSTSTTMTVTVADSHSNNYSAGPSFYSFSANGIYYFTYYYTASPGATTVTATRSSALAGQYALYTQVLTGANTNQTGAASNTTSGNNTTASLTGSITPTAASSWVSAAIATTISGTSQVPAGGIYQDYQFWDTTDGGSSSMGHTITPSTPAAETIGWTSTANEYYVWAAIEILAAPPPPGVSQDPSTPTFSNTVGGNNLSNLNSGTTQWSFSSVSFSPPAGSLVAVPVALSLYQSVSPGTLGMTCADNHGNTYTTGISVIANPSYASAAIFWFYYATAPGATTVTITVAAAIMSQTNASVDLQILVEAGCASIQTGAGSGSAVYGSGNVNVNQNVTVTTTQAGSRVIVINCNGGNVMTPTAATTNLAAPVSDGSSNQFATGWTATTTTPGAVNVGWTTSAADQGAVVALELLPSAAGPPPTLIPQQERVRIPTMAVQKLKKYATYGR